MVYHFILSVIVKLSNLSLCINFVVDLEMVGHLMLPVIFSVDLEEWVI